MVPYRSSLTCYFTAAIALGSHERICTGIQDILIHYWLIWLQDVHCFDAHFTLITIICFIFITVHLLSKSVHHAIDKMKTTRQTHPWMVIPQAVCFVDLHLV